MTRVGVDAFSISLDGYGAGPDQGINHPLGLNGEDLHQWFQPTRTFQRTVLGNDGGTTGVDDDFAARGFENVGAWILGRNMFGPVRGPWPDLDWKGWWGDNPPFHVPTFVLTHHARPPLEMAGGTIFHFFTGGIHDALERARESAGGKDVRIGGGANTIQQYLREGLIDELHLAVSPVLPGAWAVGRVTAKRVGKESNLCLALRTIAELSPEKQVQSGTFLHTLQLPSFCGPSAQAAGSGCSVGLTCGRWDTNALRG